MWLYVRIFQKNEESAQSYKNTIVTKWNDDRSLSLGMFIFLGYGAGVRYLKHEYGHSVQSMLLGPFYLFLVGIPSIIWCNFMPLAKKWREGHVSYFSAYPETWADRIGFKKEKTENKDIV